MEIIVLAAGTFSKGPEKSLWDHYHKRMIKPAILMEINDKALVKKSFDEIVRSKLDKETHIVGLDEKGESLSTLQFHKFMEDLKNKSTKSLCFIIGPADGLSLEMKKRCHFLLNLGKMTWPHLLVRGLILEQIYRVQQIDKGHPYHREN